MTKPTSRNALGQKVVCSIPGEDEMYLAVLAAIAEVDLLESKLQGDHSLHSVTLSKSERSGCYKCRQELRREAEEKQDEDT